MNNESAWSALYLGAALLSPDHPRPCRCAHGTCRRCLARRGVVPPSAKALARATRLEHELDAAIAQAAAIECAPLDGDAREAHAVEVARAKAALDSLAALGVTGRRES